jgi:hypothetical protein
MIDSELSAPKINFGKLPKLLVTRGKTWVWIFRASEPR